MSGKGHHVSQSVSTLLPEFFANEQNNHGVIGFEGSLLSMTTFKDWPTDHITIFIVQKSAIKQQSTMAIVDPDEDRFFNLHIPWGTSVIFWDYGRTEDSYGRLYESITSAGTSFSEDNYYIYEFSYGANSSQNSTNNSQTYMEINKNAVLLNYGPQSVTVPNDINVPGAGYIFNIGEDDSDLDRSFKGNIAEILIFKKDLTRGESVKINAYLSKKWGLNSSVDSDQDAVVDILDLSPAGLITEPNPVLFKVVFEDEAGNRGNVNLLRHQLLFLPVEGS